MDLSDILSATHTGEDTDWEFKSARGGLPRSLWETYSAMANTEGGTILLGVEDDGAITGLRDAGRTQSDFWSTINNRSRVSRNLLSDADVSVFSIEDCEVLAIRIPRASRRQRPVFLNQNPLTGTYRRNHEGDYHCSEDEVGRMLADKSEQPADSEILDGFGLDDLDPASLTQYRNRFSARTPQHPWLSEDVQGLLIKLGGWRTDRQSGQSGLTIAGLLMFGKDESIRDPAALPQYHVDFREKLSDAPEVRWTDRLTIDGTWVGNLFQFYQKVIVRLTADLKIPFQLEPDLFRKDDTIVHEAIREATVNSLIHADYRGRGGVVIERYPHRVELSNPGSLLVSFEQMMQGGISECRNKSLQLMFQQIGGGEKAGSGIDKIRQGWASQKWRWPHVQTRSQPDRVKLTMPMLSLLPDDSVERLRRALGTKFTSLDGEQVQALVTADVEGTVSNPRLQQFSKQHPTEITRMLGDLVNGGLLVKDGYGRWASYQLNPGLFPIESTRPDIDDSGERSGSLDIGPNSSDTSGSSSDKPGSSSDMPDSSSDTGPAMFADQETQVSDELFALAEESRQNRRLKPSRTREIILAVCAGHWLTVSQIGKLLDRVPRDTRNRFLRPMVNEGVLHMKYPDDPNHPHQAYSALMDGGAETDG